MPTLFENARKAGFDDLGLAFDEDRVWSLRELTPEFLRAVGASDPKSGALADWTDSGQESDLNLIRQLVRHDLIDRHSHWLRWHAFKKVAYFRRRAAQESVTYAWATKPGRAVVAAQFAKDDGHFTGYRHDASRLHVRRLDGQFYLEVSPTYLFTWDGKQVSGHHETALSGIHRLDRHATVSQMLRMWATLLTDDSTIDQQAQPYTVGGLVEVRIPQGITDVRWKQVSAEDLGFAGEPEGVGDDELRLFSATGIAA